MRPKLICALFIPLLGLLHSARAAAPATQESLDDLFKDRGLVRNGFLIVLPAEAEIHAGAKALRNQKGKVINETAANKQREQSIKDARDLLARMNVQYQMLNERMAKLPLRAEKNQLIGAINSLIAQINLQEAKVADLKAQQGKLAAARSSYVTMTLDMTDSADKVASAYEPLLKDDPLKAAIQNYNKTAAIKLRLGPSINFLADTAFIKQCKAEVATGVIPVSFENGVPNVQVVINGKTTRTMVWDSGSAIVTLSAATADQLGLHPSRTDPVLKATVADGRVVNARVMKLDSIRLGTFTVRDIECAVMPRNVKGSADLLGDTFQSHFLCKLDMQAGELHVVPLDPQDTEKKPPPAAVRPVAPATGAAER